VTIGVVIPAYGHPAFLAEAIVSACEQECSQPVKVVVVDDGCRFPETRQTAVSLQVLYPEKLFYFRQKNTRLPGARNAGIRFLFDIDPDIEAFFFLDADNRLEPYALNSFRYSLGDDPAVGWAYPDIAFFGLSWSDDGFEIRETSVEYSKLKHLTGNISEAGSLVRAEVFRNGVYFDETMRSGLEDWDFWFSALEAGYKGIRAEQSGFIYRRRPESMLSASQREVASLQQRLRKKHSTLFSPAHILQLEQEEDPVFAIYVVGEDTVRLTSDPLLEGEILSLSEFRTKLQAKLRDELECFFPDYLLILSSVEAERWLSLNKHLRWCFWVMKEISPAICAVNVMSGQDSNYTYNMGAHIGAPKALLLNQQELKSFVRQLVPFDVRLNEVKASLTLNVPTVPWGGENQADLETTIANPSLFGALHQIVDFLREKKAWTRHQNRQYSGPAAVIVRRKLVEDVCGELNHKPYPACKDNNRDVFVISIEDIVGCSLNNLTNVMKNSKSQRHDIGCVIEHDNRQISNHTLPADWQDLVSDVVYYHAPQGVKETRQYLGHRISHRMTLPQIETASVLLRRANTVFLSGSVACLEAAGALRQHGTEVAVIYTEDTMQVTEIVAKILAYEHVIDSLITDSTDMKDLLSAAGFPAGKITTHNNF